MEDESCSSTYYQRDFDFEKLSVELGSFKKFQKFMFFIASTVVSVAAISIVDYIILAKTPAHRCKIDICDGKENPENFLNFTTKWNPTYSRWSRCYSYAEYSPENASCLVASFNPSREEACSEWVYDTSLMESTVVSEFDLVCSNSWLQPFAGSAFMFGMLLGAIIVGSLSDRYGRKVGLMVAIFLLLLGGVVASLSPNYQVFLLARVIVGIGAVAMYQAAFVLVMEFAQTAWRSFFGILIVIPFAFGEAAVALMAYIIRRWRWLEIIFVAPAIFIVSYWWIVPESVRWLMANGKIEEARKIIEKVAATNNVELSQRTKDSLDNEIENFNCKKMGQKSHLFDLYKYPNMRKKTFNLTFCWMVCALSYFGLSANSVNLSGDFFVNFALVMLVEIPSYIFSYFALERLGRKGTLCLVLFFGGFACLAAAFLPKSVYPLVVTLSMIGKFGVAAAFATVFVYTAELYPTECRSVGLGTCSMAGRIGGIIAPFIAGLSEIYEPFPLLVFGILATTSAILVLALPETTGYELQQTLEESEEFGRDQPICFFPCYSRRLTVETSD